jgi:hypothetical protein
MVFLIFDTCGGLCNQMFDIHNGINFCLKHNIIFTFRYCNFRNNNLISWNNKPFEELFDLEFLNKYNLYINYDTIQNDITEENCYNYNSIRSNLQIDPDKSILEQINNFNKKYVVLTQFWCVNKFRNISDNTIFSSLIPSNHIMLKYNEIKNKLDEPYNFIHYRYEHDFLCHFNCTVESLDKLLQTISFENNDLKIYIATSNIKNILDVTKHTNILYKNDDELHDLNFEQKAFIDYMIGLNSVEACGNRNSSFSHMICGLKGSKYYA